MKNILFFSLFINIFIGGYVIKMQNILWNSNKERIPFFTTSLRVFS